MQLFIAMGTQWRVGMGGAIGLDYVALPILAKAMGIRLGAGRMAGLRVMEDAALKALEERKATPAR